MENDQKKPITKKELDARIIMYEEYVTVLKTMSANYDSSNPPTPPPPPPVN